MLTGAAREQISGYFFNAFHLCNRKKNEKGKNNVGGKKYRKPCILETGSTTSKKKKRSCGIVSPDKYNVHRAERQMSSTTFLFKLKI